MKNHTIRILEGILTLEIGPFQEGEPIEIRKLTAGMAHYLSSNTIHRFCADDDDVKIIEVSNQGPDDSVRLEDDYKRIVDHPEPLRSSEK